MIKILYDSECEMMRIENNKECIFEGNYWDFNRSPQGIKNLFDKLEINIEIEEKEYNEWYL